MTKKKLVRPVHQDFGRALARKKYKGSDAEYVRYLAVSKCLAAHPMEGLHHGTGIDRKTFKAAIKNFWEHASVKTSAPKRKRSVYTDEAMQQAYQMLVGTTEQLYLAEVYAKWKAQNNIQGGSKKRFSEALKTYAKVRGDRLIVNSRKKLHFLKKTDIEERETFSRTMLNILKEKSLEDFIFADETVYADSPNTAGASHVGVRNSLSGKHVRASA